jgi:hypothetical protein
LLALALTSSGGRPVVDGAPRGGLSITDVVTGRQGAAGDARVERILGMASIVARPADFWRLAELARRRGIRLLLEPSSQMLFATSGTDPAVIHHVGPDGCTCPGYVQWRRCTHHALLIAQLGWLPDVDEEPTLSASSPIPCALCDGAGRFDPETPCPVCGGAGDLAPLA